MTIEDKSGPPVDSGAWRGTVGAEEQRASRRLNLAQLRAAQREGFKDGFNAGRRAANEQAHIDGYRKGLQAGQAFAVILARRMVEEQE